MMMWNSLMSSLILVPCFAHLFHVYDHYPIVFSVVSIREGLIVWGTLIIVRSNQCLISELVITLYFLHLSWHLFCLISITHTYQVEFPYTLPKKS